MEIFRNESRHAGKQRAWWDVVERPCVVGHHIVEVDTETEAMRRFDEPEQISFRPVTRCIRATLISIAEIESIDRVIAYGIGARAAFGWLGQPPRSIARFGDFWDTLLDLSPRSVEVLQNRFLASRGGEQREAGDGERESVKAEHGGFWEL
jgi:hypothetical protein